MDIRIPSYPKRELKYVNSLVRRCGCTDTFISSVKTARNLPGKFGWCDVRYNQVAIIGLLIIVLNAGSAAWNHCVRLCLHADEQIVGSFGNRWANEGDATRGFRSGHRMTGVIFGRRANKRLVHRYSDNKPGVEG